MKPLLAATIEDINTLNYPVLVTPKIDGIRCLTFKNGVPKSRKLKVIPNKHIQFKFAEWGATNLDGELIIKGAKTFGETSGPIMRMEGHPGFEYLIFDMWDDSTMPYKNRINNLQCLTLPKWAKLLRPKQIKDPAALLAYEKKCLSDGHEGVMVRDPEGLYKFGRSGKKEGILLKLKRFSDSEAEILGAEERMHNANPAKKDNLGRTERSSHKANLIGRGDLGKFIVRDLKSGIEFEIGTGFNDAQRAEYWDKGANMLGLIVKYKHQSSGAKEKPRFPVFLGFRDPIDM